MQKIIKIYNRIEEYFADLLLFSAVALVFASILMRYVFKLPIPWADEVYTIVFAWAMTLGYSVAARDDEHIKMDAIDLIIKNKTVLRVLDIVSAVFSIVFSWILCYYGYLAMMQQYTIGRVTPTLLIPRWVVYMIIPFTGLMMTLRYVRKLLTIIRGMGKHSETED